MVHWDQDQVIGASLGGLILGLATSFNLATTGQITGMSGILNNVIRPNQKTFSSRITLLFCMFIVSAICILFLTPQDNPLKYFNSEQMIQNSLSDHGYIISGFLIGYGTKLGNGCTSGHGLCGLPRFSKRSFVAVGTFLLAGILTSTTRYYLFQDSQIPLDIQMNSDNELEHKFLTQLILVICSVFIFVMGYKYKQNLSEQIMFGITGTLFSIGMIVSGMVKQNIVLGFLTINSSWNPALMFVLGCGVGVNLFLFYLIQKNGKTISGKKLCIPTNKTIDWKLVFGEVCFGIGWGLSGICPGPLICNLPLFYKQTALLFFPSLIAGSYIVDKQESILKNLSSKNLKQK